MDADDLTRIRLAQISGLYETARNPYPGAVSQTVRCDARLVPHPQTVSAAAGPATYYSAYLNNRLQYGACADSQQPHTVRSLLFYCMDTKRWVSVERIESAGVTPEAEARRFLTGIGCR